MFREMRRKRQALPAAECEKILERGTSGVLAVAGDGGYPYAVPLSYVYREGKIYFHCAKSGHKLDALRRCDKASFCVIDRDEVVPEAFTTYFRSVIAFGRVRVLQERAESDGAIDRLARKYCPEAGDGERAAEIERERAILCVLEMSVEHMTGKEAIELVQKRNS